MIPEGAVNNNIAAETFISMRIHSLFCWWPAAAAPATRPFEAALKRAALSAAAYQLTTITCSSSQVIQINSRGRLAQILLIAQPSLNCSSSFLQLPALGGRRHT